MDSIINSIRRMILIICRNTPERKDESMLDDYLDLFEHLLLFIMNKHRNQLDKTGDHYYKHPLTVLYICLHNFDIKFEQLGDVIKLCLLHDVIEDTDCSIEELKHYGVNEKQLSLLTRDEDVPYSRYINTISRSEDITVIRVKMSDLIHNLDMSRLSKLNSDTYAKLYNKYSRVLRILFFKHTELLTGVQIPMECVTDEWELST